MRRERQILTILGIGLLLAACGGGAPAAPTATPAQATTPASPGGLAGGVYTDPKGRFSFTAPPGWTVGPTQGPYDVVTLTSPTSPATFTVTAFDEPKGATLAQFTQKFTPRMQAVGGYAPGVLGTQDVTLGGVPAQQSDFYATNDAGMKVYVIQIVSLKVPAAYVLTYTRPQADQASPNEMDAITGTWTFR